MAQAQTQTMREQFTVKQDQYDQGYVECYVTWPVPFIDPITKQPGTKYTATFSHSKMASASGEVGKNAYFNCGWRDKTPTKLSFVFGIVKGAGAKVGDVIEVDVQAVYDPVA